MTNDNRTRFTLRLPSYTDNQISKEAKKLGISKNAFILLVLNEVFKSKGNISINIT